MYQLSAPVFAHNLTNLVDILEKAAGFAEAKKLDPSVLPNSRLAPDMYPLAFQVQSACDTAKGCVARLAGQEPPVFPDNEKTLPELIERVRKTITFIQGFNAVQIDGTEDKPILFAPAPGYEFKFTGISYLQTFAIPNFYFHFTTAYAILRHNGVEIGKGNYLGKIQ
jgi:hypothetical protein